MKAKKLIVCAVALSVAMVLLSGCFSGLGRSRNSANKAPQSVVPGSAPTQSVASGAAPTHSIIESDKPQSVESRPSVLETKTVTLGDTIVTTRWEVSVESVTFGDTDKEGNIWFETYLSVKNLQQESEDPFDWFDPIIHLELDYNDGYKYTGGTGFGSYTYIKPLETKSNIEYSIKCPQEVEDNTAAPLVLNITVEGVKYQLTVR